jgi:protoheme IX farnesyltransferase
LLYAIVLVPAGASPWLLGYAGVIYGVVALVAGALMVALAWRLRVARGGAEKAAMQLFAFSILYLFTLFAVLLIESGLSSLLGRAAA